ncbi:MAG: hypothetical protein AM326_05240 [Candidatus Thorarchaeota archaeon SMTZ-45]|nr:MAG: hypothetical protein AM325_13430 [Candidatus Thorarchaeota archaeon SMTZ1-45]KXH77341.1 MAG: hypothetical protein AM326_05240 [Candidatus Thorarchaeota archaeon SMTZ-45]
MGDFKKELDVRPPNGTSSYRVQTIAVLMTLIALFAPIAVAGQYYGLSFYINITAMLWTIFMNEYGVTIQFFDLFVLLYLVPFHFFRIAFVFQIVRYYQEKTTRRRTAVAALLSEAPFLAFYILWLITFGALIGLGFNFPTPIMMIIGLLLLWRFPVSEVTVPWEGVSEPTPWWEEELKARTEPVSNDQPW